MQPGGEASSKQMSRKVAHWTDSPSLVVASLCFLERSTGSHTAIELHRSFSDIGLCHIAASSAWQFLTPSPADLLQICLPCLLILNMFWNQSPTFLCYEKAPQSAEPLRGTCRRSALGAHPAQSCRSVRSWLIEQSRNKSCSPSCGDATENTRDGEREKGKGTYKKISTGYHLNNQASKASFTMVFLPVLG